jgi:hypothetical protein
MFRSSPNTRACAAREMRPIKITMSVQGTHDVAATMQVQDGAIRCRARRADPCPVDPVGNNRLAFNIAFRGRAISSLIARNSSTLAPDALPANAFIARRLQARRSSHDGLVELLDTLPADDQATHSLAMRRPQRYGHGDFSSGRC